MVGLSLWSCDLQLLQLSSALGIESSSSKRTKKKKVAWQCICFPLSFSWYDFSGSSSAFDCEAKSVLGRSRRRRWFGWVFRWDLKCLFSSTLGTTRITGAQHKHEFCEDWAWRAWYSCCTSSSFSSSASSCHLSAPHERSCWETLSTMLAKSSSSW